MAVRLNRITSLASAIRSFYNMNLALIAVTTGGIKVAERIKENWTAK
jgi:pyrimidine operon attenuation protein/uracil phosphoribosyltransferase